jgi:RNA polymerase sigma-70 factor (family 1)
VSDINKVLLEALKKGDEGSFKEIYTKNWKYLFDIAFQKTKDQDVAEEIIQNIFIDLWVNRESKKIMNLRAYLVAAVRYGIINYIKNQIVRNKYLLHHKLVYNDTEESIETLFNLKELTARIELCLLKLPKKTQNIFRASRFELLSNKQIAQHYNISEKAVEYHITQSLKSLRVLLKDYAIIVAYFFF